MIYQMAALPKIPDALLFIGRIATALSTPDIYCITGFL